MDVQTAQDVASTVSTNWNLFTTIVEYKPLWVFFIVLGVTQIGKYAVVHMKSANAWLHTLIVRGIAAATGVLSAVAILSGTVAENAVAGLALSVAAVFVYHIAVWSMSRDGAPSWMKKFALWLSGKSE